MCNYEVKLIYKASCWEIIVKQKGNIFVEGIS